MLVGNDAYEKFIEYIENKINFDFLSHIPGSDDTLESQRESIINLIKSSKSNEAFLDYISYTYTILENDIIRQIISISWLKGNGIEDRIINDDKFELDNNELINYISVLLVLRDIMHTSYIASLPIYYEYKYEPKEFIDKAREMIEHSISNISTLEHINPIFIAIAAKSVLPYSITNDELSSSSKLIAILFNLSRIMASYPYSDKIIENTQPIFSSALYNLVNNASFLGLDYKMVRVIYDKAKTGEIKWKN
ncbi:pyridoxine kinase [Brachyspira murdochii]|uniref:Pyridoxine kinase n=1 Tax=Brachyspira murdochii TaxID=84378 RepID=A0ABX5B5C9_9SPIR|nr:pyridoxine kinase [Brachyspira murdochii]PPS21837.1 pyridoxine kinase [Brachyspira murdochii]